MKTTQIKALANRRHTKAQLDRARRTLSEMTADERAAANRIAAKYGITDEQAVANLATIVDACDDDSPDIEPLTADPTETRAAVARIAAKYGITTEDIEAMSLDDFTRLVATHHRNGTPAETLAKLAKGLGKHPAEIERDAAITFAKINATEAERLRQENANTVQEAAADIAALSQKHDSEMAELTRAKMQLARAEITTPQKQFTIGELATEKGCSIQTVRRHYQEWGYIKIKTGCSKQSPAQYVKRDTSA